jgi:hypothetical protein
MTVVIVCAVASIGRANAADQIIDVQPCDFFCKLWRNLSGDAKVSGPIDNTATYSTPLPKATDGAETPVPSKVVAEPGVVVRETPAERAAARQRKLALERETTKHVVDGENTMRKVLGDKVDVDK